MRSDVSHNSHRLLWFFIMLLALVRGGLYASLMPPWGLIDEEQHMHYIQHIVEYQSPPIVGETYLSPEIIESAFAVQRWEKFRWPTPPSQNPQDMGLEGHSYEGYQPPLFYVVLAPLYAILPEPILVKMYALRWACVGLSLLTVWFAYLTAKEIFPKQPMLPYFICLLLVVIPERTASVSRINNDVLLEVIAAFFILVCTWSTLRGLSVRYSQLLGVSLGLGVLTKASMAFLAILLPVVFWKNRRQADWWTCVFWTGGIAGCLIMPFVIYNWLLYGDLTGYSGFRSLIAQSGAFRVPTLTILNLINEGLDLFRHLWAVWWRGNLARKYVVTNIFLGILAILSCAGGIGLFRYLKTVYHRQDWRDRLWIVGGYLLVIGVCVSLVMWVRFDGRVPSIQGRFLLPVIVPIVVLFGLGLWHGPGGKFWALAIVVVLIVFDGMLLIGEVHFFYYPSDLVDASIGSESYSWYEIGRLYYTRFLSDKPVAMRPVLLLIVPLYIAPLGFVWGVGWRTMRYSSSAAGSVRCTIGL